MTTKTAHSLRLTRSVAATAQRAFEAWTRPEHLKRWAAPEGYEVVAADVDLKVGGTYRIQMRSAEGTQHTAFGTYRAISAPTKLVYTWAWADGKEAEMGETLVTVEFRERGGRTEIVLVHDLFPSEDARDNHNQGWSSCLDRLVSVVG